MMPVTPVEKLVKTEEINDNEFKAVINKMILDNVSDMVKSDTKILMIGKRLFDSNKCRSEKTKDVEKRVRSVIRQLAGLYIFFK